MLEVVESTMLRENCNKLTSRHRSSNTTMAAPMTGR